MTSNFKKYFDFYTNKIKERHYMALYRFGDGELMLTDGKAIKENTQANLIDNWRSPSELTLLGKDLINTLHTQGPNIHFGIPCTCCNPSGNLRMKKLITKSPTFPANIFINANYTHFKNFLPTLRELPIATWINHKGNTSQLPFKTIREKKIGDDCVNLYKNNRIDLLNEARNFCHDLQNTIFFIAAGPLTEVLIHTMWNQNPNNTYVDVGSALDEYIYKKNTRPYQIHNSHYSTLSCSL